MSPPSRTPRIGSIRTASVCRACARCDSLIGSDALESRQGATDDVQCFGVGEVVVREGCDDVRDRIGRRGLDGFMTDGGADESVHSR